MDPKDAAGDFIVYLHLRKHFGKEARLLRFDDDLPEGAPNPITILEFAPPSDEYDWVYATMGMSKTVQKLEIDGKIIMHRTELMLYSNVQSDEIINTLLSLAVYPFVNDTVFNVGDLVAGSLGQGVVTGSPLTEVLLSRFYGESEEFQVVGLSDGDTAHILFVVSIYMSERLFVREHGYREIVKLFGAQDTDTSDFWRKPVV